MFPNVENVIKDAEKRVERNFAKSPEGKDPEKEKKLEEQRSENLALKKEIKQNITTLEENKHNAKIEYMKVEKKVLESNNTKENLNKEIQKHTEEKIKLEGQINQIFRY